MTPTLQALITASESKTTRILEKAEGVSAREIVGMMDDVVRLRTALKKAEDTFHRYYELHMEKNPPDFAKAEANLRMSKDCKHAIDLSILQSGNKGKDNG